MKVNVMTGFCAALRQIQKSQSTQQQRLTETPLAIDSVLNGYITARTTPTHVPLNK